MRGLPHFEPAVTIDHHSRRHDLTTAAHPDGRGLSRTEHGYGRVRRSGIDADIDGDASHGVVVSWSAGPRITWPLTATCPRARMLGRTVRTIRSGTSAAASPST